MLSTDVLLDGALDLHVHPAPSPFPRRLQLYEAAAAAAAAGFRTIAVKSHHHSMVTDIQAVEAAAGKMPLEVISGVCLNNQVGGLNPYAVELSLLQGGRFVWFPTIAAAKHLATTLRTFPTSKFPLRTAVPVPVLDGDGQLRSEVTEILELIRQADGVLACGHLDAAEIDLVIDAAVAVGVRRIVVNHPNFVVDASPDRCAAWAEKGAYIEHSLCHYVDGSTFRKWELDTLLEYVHRVGSGRTILSSDLGQAGNPTPVEAFRWIVPQLDQAGVAEAAIRNLVSTSARTLVD
jgi:hypothetical protein